MSVPTEEQIVALRRTIAGYIGASATPTKQVLKDWHKALTAILISLDKERKG